MKIKLLLIGWFFLVGARDIGSWGGAYHAMAQVGPFVSVEQCNEARNLVAKMSVSVQTSECFQGE